MAIIQLHCRRAKEEKQFCSHPRLVLRVINYYQSTTYYKYNQLCAHCPALTMVPSGVISVGYCSTDFSDGALGTNTYHPYPSA